MTDQPTTLDDDLDRLGQLCQDAAATTTGRRLVTSLYTDELMQRVVAGHPDRVMLADELGADAIVDAAEAEHAGLDEEDRERVADLVTQRFTDVIGLAARSLWRAENRRILEGGGAHAGTRGAGRHGARDCVRAWKDVGSCPTTKSGRAAL